MARDLSQILIDVDYATLNRRVQEVKDLVRENPHLFRGDEGIEAVILLIQVAVVESITVRPDQS